MLTKSSTPLVTPKVYSPKEIVDLIAYGADIKRDFPEDTVPVQMAEALQQLFNQQYSNKTVAAMFSEISIREQCHWLRTQDRGMAARMLEEMLDTLAELKKAVMWLEELDQTRTLKNALIGVIKDMNVRLFTEADKHYAQILLTIFQGKI